MKRLYYLIIAILILIIGAVIYNYFAYLNITVKFDDLEPMEKQMNVYYKGFKIGRSVKIYPDKDFTNTFLKLKIQPRNIKLPSNITAIIKKSPAREYINILYPSSPSLEHIRNGMTIYGKHSKDIKNILNESFEEEDIDLIVNDATTLIESANVTVQNLGLTFERINKLLDDINDDILSTTANISKTTKNIENISDNLNYALDRDKTKLSFDNILGTTENIKNITDNVAEITNQIENETIPSVNSVLCETGSTMENIEEITSGINTTLKKRLGFWRLMFGKPVNSCY